MPQIGFTDRAIAALPTPDKGQVDYFCKGEPGFAIRVSLGGTKAWFIKYLFKGTQYRLPLGRYPSVTLAAARALARDVKHDVAHGTNPALVRRLDREAPTFYELAEIFIERHAKPKKRSWREDQRILLKYCRPWHPRKAADITRADVVDLLHRIASGGAGVMGNRVLACVRKVYNYGIKNGHVEANPAYMVDAPAAETSRERVYTENELRRLWPAFGERGLAGSVFKFCLITGQRLSEVRGLPWDEIEGDLWTLPGARTKNRRIHIVPLSDMALELLEPLRLLDSEWVFPSPRKKEKPLTHTDKAMAAVREISGVKDYITHDLRRTMTTGLTALGFPKPDVGRLLNHTETGVTATYDRHDYLSLKKDLVTAWGRRLREILAGGGPSVVPMPQKRRA